MSGLEMKYFVLKPKGDDEYAKASRNALRAYARYIYAVNPELAKDLEDWANRETAATIANMDEEPNPIFEQERTGIKNTCKKRMKRLCCEIFLVDKKCPKECANYVPIPDDLPTRERINDIASAVLSENDEPKND